MAEQQERCETCRFYGVEQCFGTTMGNACLRYPKAVQKDPSAWCGEYQPTPVPARDEEKPNAR